MEFEVRVLAALDNLQKQMQEGHAAMRGDLRQLQEDQTAMRGDIGHLQGDVRQLQGDVRDLREGQTAMRGDIRQLEEGQAELRAENKTINEKLELVADTVMGIADDMQAVSTHGVRIARLEDRTHAIESHIGLSVATN